MLEGVDVSYAQGNYKPGAEDFVIINASRANIGLAVGSQYRNQVANARAAGKHVGHYFFNGNVDPVRCANYFVDNLSYQAGDSLWLDVEHEPSTSTVAWSPTQALAFINQVRARLGVVPGVYLNKSLMDSSDWSAVVATGAPLWIAYYNPTPPPIRWWPTWTVWQYTSTPIDRNKAQSASLAALTASPISNLSEQIGTTDMSQLRAITSPSYRSAGKQVITNGTTADEFDNNVALSVRQGGADSHDYDRDDQLVTELNVIYRLSGLERDAAATKVAEIVSGVINQ
jgi:hypothetical protein